MKSKKWTIIWIWHQFLMGRAWAMIECGMAALACVGVINPLRYTAYRSMIAPMFAPSKEGTTTDVRTADSIRAWYNRHHASNKERSWRKPWWYAHYLDLLGIKGPMPKASFLDIGCGVGWLAASAARMVGEVHAVDISDEGLEIAKRINGAGVTYHNQSGTNLSNFRDGSFDFVSCTGALEHFEDIEAGLSEMVRVGRPGAKYCIVLPNSKFPLWKIRKAGTVQTEIGETMKSLSEWRTMIERAGLSVLSVGHDTYHYQIERRWWIRMLWEMLPLEWTYVFEIVAEK